MSCSWSCKLTSFCLLLKCAVAGNSSRHPCMTAKLWPTFSDVTWQWCGWPLIDAAYHLSTLHIVDVAVLVIWSAGRALCCTMPVTWVVSCDWLCLCVRQVVCNQTDWWAGLQCCSSIDVTNLQAKVDAAVICCLLSWFIWSLYPQRTDIALATVAVVLAPVSSW